MRQDTDEIKVLREDINELDGNIKEIGAEVKGQHKDIIDWHRRESSRSKIRVLIKRALRKWGYPPDMQDEAVKTVLKQAEALTEELLQQ